METCAKLRDAELDQAVREAQADYAAGRIADHLQGLYSASINLSYRITLEFLIEGSTIIPVTVGFHDGVYGG